MTGAIELGSDDVSLNFVDMWGQNAYLGYDSYCYFDFYERLSSKPLVITEYGVDAYDMNTGLEYPSVQTEWAPKQWQRMFRQSVGGTIMAYSDEWWKAGDPNTHDTGGYYTDQHPDGFSNEEYWGTVAVNSSGACDTVFRREVSYALQDAFAVQSVGNCDFDADGDVDLDDAASFTACFTGPNGGPLDTTCAAGDADADDDIDCRDWDAFVFLWNASGPAPGFSSCRAQIPTLSDTALAIFASILLLAGGIMILRQGCKEGRGLPSDPSLE